MTMPTSLPFGVRDLKLIPYTDATATVLATSMVDLPYIRSLSFTESEDFEDLRGDDQLVTSHGSGAWVEWEMESGGLSLEAYVVMSGGTLTVTGIAPNITKKFRKRVTDVKPWFCIVGQSISDSGGDLHTVIYRARVTDNLEGSFEDQSFFMTSGKGKGFGSWRSTEYGTLYDFVNHQTMVGIVIPPVLSSEVQQVAITGSPTGGTFTMTLGSSTSSPIPYNATAAQVQAALENMASIGFGNVACTGGPLPTTPVIITFQGTMGGQDVTQMTAASSLTGGSSPTVTVTTTTPGGV